MGLVSLHSSVFGFGALWRAWFSWPFLYGFWTGDQVFLERLGSEVECSARMVSVANKANLITQRTRSGLCGCGLARD